jgi:hypothetical protein
MSRYPTGLLIKKAVAQGLLVRYAISQKNERRKIRFLLCPALQQLYKVIHNGENVVSE